MTSYISFRILTTCARLKNACEQITLELHGHYVKSAGIWKVPYRLPNLQNLVQESAYTQHWLFYQHYKRSSSDVVWCVFSRRIMVPRKHSDFLARDEFYFLSFFIFFISTSHFHPTRRDQDWSGHKFLDIIVYLGCNTNLKDVNKFSWQHYYFHLVWTWKIRMPWWK